MSHNKIKVMAATQNEWNTIIAHARSLGALSRDGQYGYNPEKTAMVVDNFYIKYSSPTMKTKAGFVAPTKISVRDFLDLTSLHDVANIGKPVDKAAVANAVAAVRASMPCAQNTLKVKDCDVLVQNAVVWASKGLPMLKSLGVDITVLGDKNYIIDISSNDAKEITPETASAQAKADILECKVTPYTQWAKNCDLISNMDLAKELPEA